MNKALRDHLQTLFDLTTDLANALDESCYAMKLGTLPSNTFGEQMHCIVGIRESYLMQLCSNEWPGFSSTVEKTENKLHVMRQLYSSSSDVLAWLDKNRLRKDQLSIILKLIEHEAQHHGQLIRYVYGNKWVFPQSWSDHYTV